MEPPRSVGAWGTGASVRPGPTRRRSAVATGTATGARRDGAAPLGRGAGSGGVCAARPDTATERRGYRDGDRGERDGAAPLSRGVGERVISRRTATERRGYKDGDQGEARWSRPARSGRGERVISRRTATERRGYRSDAARERPGYVKMRAGTGTMNQTRSTTRSGTRWSAGSSSACSNISRRTVRLISASEAGRRWRISASEPNSARVSSPA